LRRICEMSKPELAQMSLSSFFFERKNRGLSEGLAGIGMFLLKYGHKLSDNRIVVSDNAILRT